MKVNISEERNRQMERAAGLVSKDLYPMTVFEGLVVFLTFQAQVTTWE
jgi:hypothetical protein